MRRFGRPGGSDERIVVLPDRGRLALLSVGALAFVVGGFWMLSRGRLDGVLPIAFFGACGLYSLWRLVVPRPLLVIDRQGIHDNASPMGGGRIPWAQITGCGVCEYRGQLMVGIGLVEPAAHLARLISVKRRLVQANMGLGFPPVLIPQSILPIPAGELAAEIEAFRARAL
jgi:hypothetical protein